MWFRGTYQPAFQMEERYAMLYFLMATKDDNMKHFLVGLVLATCALTATASDWVPLINNNVYSSYVDVSSITTISDFKQAWSMMDLKKPGEIGGIEFFSVKKLDIFSCSDRTYSTKKIFFYPEPQGYGRLVHSSIAPMPFQDIAPDTSIEVIWQKVCGKN